MEMVLHSLDWSERRGLRGPDASKRRDPDTQGHQRDTGPGRRDRPPALGAAPREDVRADRERVTLHDVSREQGNLREAGEHVEDGRDHPESRQRTAKANLSVMVSIVVETCSPGCVGRWDAPGLNKVGGSYTISVGYCPHFEGPGVWRS